MAIGFCYSIRRRHQSVFVLILAVIQALDAMLAAWRHITWKSCNQWTCARSLRVFAHFFATNVNFTRVRAVDISNERTSECRMNRFSNWSRFIDDLLRLVRRLLGIREVAADYFVVSYVGKGRVIIFIL